MIAAVRDTTRAEEAFSSLGLRSPVVGRQPDGNGGGILFLESGVDVTNEETLTADLFKGVQQIICSLGPVFGRTSDGQMGYLDNMTSERVDSLGVANIAAAAAKYITSTPTSTQRTVTQVLPMKTEEDLATWQRLDDVIMGGSSSSGLECSPDGSGAVWKGVLVVQGGGFCGARTVPAPLDLSSYDGVSLRIKSDQGQTLKLNIKTDTFSEPEDTYQATIETLPQGDWSTVYLPWHEFVPVKRARSLPGGPPLDPSKIRQFGLVYSRFAFNGFPNESHSPGPFEIHFAGGINAYTAPRSQIVLISSAGVERNAKIGDDVEVRKKDIPIVQLNPGGTLNHKYSAEIAVRSIPTGLSYTIVRPTGMSDDAGGATDPALLEASQGDRISGKVSRTDVASVVAAAVNLPGGVGVNKTFEVRRSEAADAQGREMTSQDMLRLFLGVAPDRFRAKIGLEPFPGPAPPPPPPTDERKAEILADSRVKAAQERNAGGRVRSEDESKGSSSGGGGVTQVDDGRAAIAKKNDEIPPPANVADARDWIRQWRAKNLERQLP